MARVTRMGPAALVSTLLAVSMFFSSALAAGINLRSGLLRASDAPPGFLHPKNRTYRHFEILMKMPVIHAGKPGRSNCTSPPQFQGYGWRQGLIEAFDTKQRKSELRLCAWLFKSVKGARKAYKRERAFVQTLIRIKTDRLIASRIGDESIAGVPRRKTYWYEVVFRHGSAVADLVVFNPVKFKPTDLLNLGSLVNSRLH